MILRRNRRASRRSAFTLTEILVVVAIIVVLAGVAVPVIIGQMDSAKKSLAESQCKHLAEAVQAFIDDPRVNKAGDVPTSWDQIPGINPDALRDPWGGTYQLIVPSQHGHKEGPDQTGFDVQCDCGGHGDVVGNW